MSCHRSRAAPVAVAGHDHLAPSEVTLVHGQRSHQVPDLTSVQPPAGPHPTGHPVTIWSLENRIVFKFLLNIGRVQSLEVMFSNVNVSMEVRSAGVRPHTGSMT